MMVRIDTIALADALNKTYRTSPAADLTAVERFAEDVAIFIKMQYPTFDTVEFLQHVYREPQRCAF
jgi:hypothetical protein